MGFKSIELNDLLLLVRRKLAAVVEQLSERREAHGYTLVRGTLLSVVPRGDGGACNAGCDAGSCELALSASCLCTNSRCLSAL